MLQRPGARPKPRPGPESETKLVTTSLTRELFPEPAELVVTAKSAFLKRTGSTEILFQNLSDGYRSMLALSIDLLHWLTDAFPDAADPLQCPGVALIGELATLTFIPPGSA